MVGPKDDRREGKEAEWGKKTVQPAGPFQDPGSGAVSMGMTVSDGQPSPGWLKEMPENMRKLTGSLAH